MINPRELRIGNLVYCAQSKWNCRVDRIAEEEVTLYVFGEHCDEYEVCSPEQLEPMLITESKMRGLCFYNNKEQERILNLNLERKDETYLYKGREITTMHQMQNLYYAITGEELRSAKLNGELMYD